jgi:hypothetical protein
MDNRLALHWQGASTKPLFSSLLQRRLISDAIENTYGLTPDFQAAWLGAPLDLKAQLRNDGPFKASIQLSVVFHARHAETLQTGLASVASNLELRGLRPQVNPSAAGTNGQSTVLMWKDKGQSVLGVGPWSRRRQIRSPFDYPWVERQPLVFRLQFRRHPQDCASVLTRSSYEIWAG